MATRKIIVDIGQRPGYPAKLMQMKPTNLIPTHSADSLLAGLLLLSRAG